MVSFCPVFAPSVLDDPTYDVYGGGLSGISRMPYRPELAPDFFSPAPGLISSSPDVINTIHGTTAPMSIHKSQDRDKTLWRSRAIHNHSRSRAQSRPGGIHRRRGSQWRGNVSFRHTTTVDSKSLAPSKGREEGHPNPPRDALSSRPIRPDYW